MAHFAELDENNVVTRVIVIDNNDMLDSSGEESEEVGRTFCLQFGSGPWVQTSYNNNFRKRFAGIGYTYDEANDRFVSPQPYASWVLNDDTCIWEPPVPYPNDGNRYRWDEDTVSWEQE